MRKKKIKKPKIRITALQKGDEKTAKIAEKIINSELETYKGVIGAIIDVHTFLNQVYGIKIKESMWNKILEEVVKMRMKIL